MQKIETAGKLLKVEFASDTLPQFIEKKNKKYVLFGKDNNWPGFIIDLIQQHPEHNAIIKTKAKYVYGKGLRVKSENTLDRAIKESFLSRANRFEDWNSIYEKTCKPLEIYNGFAWQIVWNISGTACEVYTIQFSKLRKSPDGKKIYYCDEWVDECGKPITNPEKKESFQEFDAFNPNVRKGTQILYYIVPEETVTEHGDTYPIPEYIGAVTAIATDIGVIDFQHYLVKNGMTAQGMLSLFNGEPTPDEKKQIAKLFEWNHTGPKKAGRVIFNFVDNNPGQEGKGAEYLPFTATDLDKQFEQMCKNNQQKIITGHGITNKALVGISTEGALSDRTSIIESYEQFYNNYVVSRQQIILNEIKMIASLCGVDLSGVDVQRTAPLDVDVTNPNVSKYLTEDEVREKLGYAPKEGASPAPSVPQAQQSNENLKGLTGTEWIHIKRLIREVSKGVTSWDAAAMLIKNAYQLGDEDINVLLGPKPSLMSSQDYFQLFADAAIDESPDEVVSTSYCFTREQAFKDKEKDYQNNPKDLANGILDLLIGNDSISPKRISQLLGVSEDKIYEGLSNLKTLGLIDDNYVPTQKGTDRTTPPVETETYTVYKYVVRPDVPQVETTSRDFCKRMLALTASGKVWTREALDNLTNQIGEDAWVYRGGFYTNPKTGETTPYCRHIWMAIVKTRRKNG